MDNTVRVMAPGVEETTKCIFHGTGSGRVDMTLHRREMDNIFVAQKSGDADAFWIDLVQNPHAGCRMIFRPGNVFGQKIIFLWDCIAQVNRIQFVQLTAFKCVGHDSVIVHGHEIIYSRSFKA